MSDNFDLTKFTQNIIYPGPDEALEILERLTRELEGVRLAFTELAQHSKGNEKIVMRLAKDAEIKDEKIKEIETKRKEEEVGQDKLIAKLQAENVVMSDRIEELEAEIKRLRDGIAGLTGAE
ncbi:hypothetical protein UCRNP2_4095 [Neofusicoccum parvum UCRNP2]|uniref:Uncharacterized protein n=2 Tax=Neofusicoccum parvum TaxID=310453 RepID=R1EMX5_BOTPV|nr:hypothetical protein UCRNP2_4095 [Neofusicoccum parvum UCRNP2]